jgi:hypothetical protein
MWMRRGAEWHGKALLSLKKQVPISITDTKVNDVDTFHIRHILELKFLKKIFVWENGTGSRNLAGSLSHIDAFKTHYLR